MMINYTMAAIERNGGRPHKVCSPLPAGLQAIADRCNLPWRDAGCRVRKAVKVAPHAGNISRERRKVRGEMVTVELRK